MSVSLRANRDLDSAADSGGTILSVSGSKATYGLTQHGCYILADRCETFQYQLEKEGVVVIVSVVGDVASGCSAKSPAAVLVLYAEH